MINWNKEDILEYLKDRYNRIEDIKYLLYESECRKILKLRTKEKFIKELARCYNKINVAKQILLKL